MLFLAAVVAATVAAAPANGSPPDGTYNYSITQSGSQIGTSTVTLKHAGADLTIHESETMGDLSFVVDETVDAASLTPKSYVATYTKGTGSQTARAAFDRTGATVSLDNVPGTQFFPLTGGLKNAYVLELSIITGLFLLPAQIHASNASQFLDIIPSGVASLPNHVISQAAGPRPAGVPNGDASLSIASRVNFDEWYDPTTYVLHDVSIPMQDVLIKLTK
jgi:hypothetical protein